MREPTASIETITIKDITLSNLNPGTTIIVTPLDIQYSCCDFLIESLVTGGAKNSFIFKLFGSINNYENLSIDYATLIVNRNGNVRLEVLQ